MDDRRRHMMWFKAVALLSLLSVASAYHFYQVSRSYTKGENAQKAEYATKQSELREELRVEAEKQASLEKLHIAKQLEEERETNALNRQQISEYFARAKTEQIARANEQRAAENDRAARDKAIRATRNMLTNATTDLLRTKKELEKKPKTIFKTRLVEVPANEPENTEDEFTCNIPTGDVDAINPVWLLMVPELNAAGRETGFKAETVRPDG